MKYLQWKTTPDENGYTITIRETNTHPCKTFLKPSSKPWSAFVAMLSISATNTQNRNATALRQTNALSTLTSPRTTHAGTYTKEIQTVHLGGSHRQVTIHTGVVCIPGSKALPFCTISDSRLYDPFGIWCYFQSVIQLITRLNFFSDDPTSQNKQKKNFAMFLSFFSGTK